jgi:enoyl-CoA hydratase/carnithine racemase
MADEDGDRPAEISSVVEASVAVVSLNRPERRNALTRAVVQQLCDVLDDLDSDDDVRAIVITGAGSSFCVGADLEGGSRTFASPASQPLQRDYGGILALRIFRCTKPVIAAVNGDAAGLGATMTLPMDIRLSANTARFVFPFTRRGIVPEACSTWFLPRVVGVSRALEWTLSGAPVSALEAQAAGLVRTVHEPAELMAAAHQVALDLTAKSSPLSVAATRQMMWQGLTLSHPMEAHRRESVLVRSLGRGPDAAEGVDAFLQKRPAAFTSRPSRDLAPFAGWWTEPDFDVEVR